jgi:hypothetical protein
VKKRKLGQGEDAILVALWRQTRMQIGKRLFRIVFEFLVKVKIDQLARRKRACPLSRYRIGGERMIGDGAIDVIDADRRCATCREA